ncbi:hypothetical protein ABL78_3396 [Leptomonas seymouri]|uniref:Uncharacterized protein n=1 Tax=Leptomonas seymouri TaxID=5684 RepID=A0A0N1HZL0_LEPSE|nr:hypothetical protein ABL78_3396 [Leptomonas seymouri]|eukprot:KPI87518.1 hypothetical protein ABL78_3396 [Leptomonas seymouri]
MVYLRAITPALCELMDDAAKSPETAAAVRAFVEQRLHSLVHTQTPSQLDNALWILLASQEQLLQRGGEEEHKGSPTTALPPSLRLPSAIATVQDGVRWYCGELNIPTAESRSAADVMAANANAPHAPSPSPASRNARTEKHSAVLRDAPSKRHGTARQADAQLDELLRHRHQLPATGTASTATPQPAGPPNDEAAQRPHTGPIATVQLALEALSNSKRASTLRQPRSLALVVRCLATLWSLMYLCKQLRQHQLRKEQLLKGETAPAAATSLSRAPPAHASALAVGRRGTTEPLSLCFHDYDLLLPWDLVHAVLTGSPIEAKVEKARRAPLTMAAVAARCRAIADKNPHMPEASSTLSLVINPAVTDLADNPDRLRKNARIDAIDEAANKYYYSLLTTCAHGQAGRPSPSTEGNASTAAAASAAAHREALRSSLASVDLGDYGVLDPLRMRSSVPLRPAATGFSASVSSAASGASARGDALHVERSAKSYAVFLRDASIGFDIQIMALTGAGVGYYLGYLRGLSTEWCTLYAVVGLVALMLVDAVLLIIRMGRQDEALLRARKRIRRQREKLEGEGERLVQAMQRAAGGDAAVDEGGENKGCGAVDSAPPAEVDAQTKKRQ